MESTWLEYKKMAPEARLYLFDLVGYGCTPLSVGENDVYIIGGWSDRIFDVLDAIDKGDDAITAIMSTDV